MPKGILLSSLPPSYLPFASTSQDFIAFVSWPSVSLVWDLVSLCCVGCALWEPDWQRPVGVEIRDEVTHPLSNRHELRGVSRFTPLAIPLVGHAQVLSVTYL